MSNESIVDISVKGTGIRKTKDGSQRELLEVAKGKRTHKSGQKGKGVN